MVLLKMHGSLDWFDRSAYEESLEAAASSPMPYTVKHRIFGADAVVHPSPLTDRPREIDDPLLKIHRVIVPDLIYDIDYYECVPFILSPSHSKLLYAGPITSLWYSLGRAGGMNLGLGVIGYSLPDYDDYARQAIYRIARNYQRFEPNLELDGLTKTPVRLLDFRQDEAGIDDLRGRYRFLDWTRTEIWKDGMSPEAVDWLMRTSPASGSI